MGVLLVLACCVASVVGNADVSGTVSYPTPTDVTVTFPLTIRGSSPADRIFMNIRKDLINLEKGDIVSIWTNPVSVANHTFLADVAEHTADATIYSADNITDADIRSSSSALTVSFEGCGNSTFSLPYRILTAGHLKESSLCGNSAGCSYREVSGVLMFPFVPIDQTFTHIIESNASDVVFMHLDPDAIKLYSEDQLVIFNHQNCIGDAILRLSHDEPLEGPLTLSSHGSGFCATYTGSNNSSYFYISFKTIAMRFVHVKRLEDISQDYRRSTMVIWLLENVRNMTDSFLNFVVRRLEIDQSQGEFFAIGAGNRSQVLRGSPAMLISNSILPPRSLSFQVTGPNAYVMLYIGDRPGHVEPSTNVVYLEWEQKALATSGSSTPRTPFQLTSVWQEAMLICADVKLKNASTWRDSKQMIRQKYAHAANLYLKEKTHTVDRMISADQVMLPDENPILSQHGWGVRVSLLLSVSRAHESDMAFFKHDELYAIYDRMSNEDGRSRITDDRDDNDVWLSRHCREPAVTFWWFVYAAFCLGVSLVVFLAMWKWKAGSYPSRGNSKKDSKAKEQTQELVMPDTFHVNPAFIPDEEADAPDFRPTSLQHFYEDSERHIEIQKDGTLSSGRRENRLFFPRHNAESRIVNEEPVQSVPT
ncbi:uncharacterized protein LOC135366753 [Ornithodoros turicata]|uniref:uncharacterized protein LOC135366753 n=1 Tax=Ornithodoros turicata TaxID=34597 RepID=UPI00313944F5